jgi:putative tryptophan/tyrosine transport system substrate-binding protein
MNKRRELIVALGAGALVAPLGSFAQQQGKVWRIGYLSTAGRQAWIDAGRYDALLQGMRELGYVEGKNFVLEARYADGDAERLDGLAAELAQLKVDVILTFGAAASQAVQRNTATIPIVVVVTQDPVRDGFAISLARPGGNLTGMSVGTSETIQKCVELLRTMVPKLSRVAVLVNSNNASHSPMLLGVQVAAQRIGWAMLPISVRRPEDIESGFATMARERAGAVIVLPDSFFLQQRQQISTLALKHGLASIAMISDVVESGILMSYAANTNDNVHHIAIFVDKVLKGAKPGELPFELPTRYYLVINRSTAKALGLTIPQELMLRADRVIQ